jgi:hypothetical protein
MLSWTTNKYIYLNGRLLCMKFRFSLVILVLFLSLAFASAEECVCGEKEYGNCNAKTNMSTWVRICEPSECDVEYGTGPCPGSEPTVTVKPKQETKPVSNATNVTSAPSATSAEPLNFTIIWVLGTIVVLLLILIVLVIFALRKLEKS